MNDEELLKAVGRSVRAAEPHDERWDKLAAGTLTDAERAALLAEVAQSETAARAYEAYRPLGTDFQARMVERLLAPSAPAAEGADAVTVAVAAASAKVIPFRRRALRFAGVPLALAASVLVAFGALTLLRQHAVPALPGYGLRLEGQVTVMRGETPPPASAPFVRGNEFRLLLTPATKVEGKVVARSYVLAGAGPQPLVAPPARISDDGAVLIQGTVGADVQLPQGAARLLVVVGRESQLPDPRALAAQLGAAGQVQNDEWAAWMLPVSVE
jgi:hypothetical protein